VLRFAIIVLLAACGAPLQTVKITNRTGRPIDALYVYAAGATDHGPSRGQLAPAATTQVQMRAGAVEVLALSAKLKVDEHTRDQPSASQSFELHGPVEVVFYDAGDTPAGLDRPGVFGIAFVIPKPKPPAPPAEPPAEPSP
jgi:hypothetical protein